ncbi:hypothetical protein LUZ61_004830 [Rhynchospora tenuis]|uniref:Uncharacterized protein n=1 Tax=Rhynchospora tenuis TaxID=198213 RepID=A0AAD6EU71_9POAL|nr:hypothetical protein LUZ61_004830 [Rhynchospora tenuis]
MVGMINGGGYPRGWKLVDQEGSSGGIGMPPIIDFEHARQLHHHQLTANQCTSTLVKHINAPVDLVWSFVRRFDEPEKYKPFVKQCLVMGGLQVGSIRDISLTSELPATFTTEVLERLDDSERILGIRTVGGDHILKNHSSIVTVHPDSIEGRTGTTVVESFVVDLPENNTRDEICYFMEAVIKINLRSLAAVSERRARQQQ